MSAAFTSGPWQRMNDYDGHLTIIGNVDGESFSDGTTTHSYDFIANCEDEYGEPTSPANVRLILAAPELYGALSDLMENPQFATAIGGNPNMVEALMARANAALAKARGEAA